MSNVFYCLFCRYNRIAREWTQKYAMWCWMDTFIHCLFSHVLDTVARPYFSICLLWRHNPSFLLKPECRPARGLSTLQNLEMDLASLTDIPPLSALPIFDLYQSTPLTPQHVMPCMTRVCSLWAARRENVFRLFCFFGALLLECMQTQEKRSDVVHQWEIETDSYVLFDCKDLQHADQLLAQLFTAVTLRYNSLDWLKYLFKIPLLFSFQ